MVKNKLILLPTNKKGEISKNIKLNQYNLLVTHLNNVKNIRLRQKNKNIALRNKLNNIQSKLKANHLVSQHQKTQIDSSRLELKENEFLDIDVPVVLSQEFKENITLEIHEPVVLSQEFKENVNLDNLDNLNQELIENVSTKESINSNGFIHLGKVNFIGNFSYYE